jgi:hypothetical protein
VAAPQPGPARRESIASISDVSKVTDPRLVIRRHRMRRIFMLVMGGALAILALAGVCSLARRPDAPPVSTSPKVAEPSTPAVTAPAVTAAPTGEAPSAPAPQTAGVTESQASPPSAAKTPPPRAPRLKAAPHKAHAVGSR